jgi:uncharacterized membrane protein
MHAAWTLLLARAPDSEAATAAALAVAVVLFAPFAGAGWDVEAAAYPYIALSAAFELGFFATLGLALRSGHVSLVYPLSRGTAPVLVLAVSVAVLGADVGALQAAGVAMIAAGVVLVRGLGGAASARDTALALVLTVLVYLPVVARLKGRRAIVAATGPPTAVAAGCIFGAYALVLAALELAPAAPVAALRETSVVFATAYAALVLGEPAGRRRLAGAAVVVTGIAVLALA